MEIAVVGGFEVINERGGVHRRPGCAGGGLGRAELGEDEVGVDAAFRAGLVEGALAAAAVVELVGFKDPDGRRIGVDDGGEGEVGGHGWLLWSGEVDARDGGGDDNQTENGLADADDLGGNGGAGGDALEDHHDPHGDGPSGDGRVEGHGGGRHCEGGTVCDDQRPCRRGSLV